MIQDRTELAREGKTRARIPGLPPSAPLPPNFYGSKKWHPAPYNFPRRNRAMLAESLFTRRRKRVCGQANFTGSGGDGRKRKRERAGGETERRREAYWKFRASRIRAHQPRTPIRAISQTLHLGSETIGASTGRFLWAERSASPRPEERFWTEVECSLSSLSRNTIVPPEEGSRVSGRPYFRSSRDARAIPLNLA